MRRFELVEGKSAKFWQAEVSGTKFVVEYGRLGTAGQRKEKEFPNEDGARKELTKKIAEKLREGYGEVEAGAVAQAAKGKKGAEAASAKLQLPPRLQVTGQPPSLPLLARASAALIRLGSSLGKRSFVTAHAHKHARDALAALGGVDPAAYPELEKELDNVLDLAVAPKGPRLALGRCLELLLELQTPAFERAMERWANAKQAPVGIAWLATEIEALGDVELAFRLGALLLDRPGRSMSSSAGFGKRLSALMPHLQAQLIRKNSSPRKHFAAMDARGDTFLLARIAQASKAAEG